MKNEGTVTSRGRLVIPAELRRKHGIKPGTRVRFEDIDGGVLIRLVAVGSKKSKRRGYGILKGKLWAAPDAFDPLTDEELKDWGIE